MNIVYATSDLYSRPALISLKTLLMNNQEEEEINIYYVENGISDTNKGLLEDLVQEYKRKIVFVPMPKRCFEIEGLIRTDPVVYSYCYFQDVLPSTVDRVLLMESDAIVTGKLKEFYSIDIEDYYLAAVDDLQSRWYKRKLGMREDSPYFNCGIMLLNLKKWREDQITEKITTLINQGNSKFFYEVQDELNVLMEGKVKILPPRFACTTAVFLFSYKNMKRYRRPTTCCTEAEFEAGKRCPIIVHFTKNQIIQPRPWVEGCTHPYNQYYLEARQTTKLCSEPLWPARRGVVNRIAFFLYSKVSERLTAELLGIVHSFLYPVLLYRFILR